MDRIIRGYWTCPYCGTTNIDGLIDDCSNCARHKPEDIKYDLQLADDGKPKLKDVLSNEELSNAGISREECDGKHKEWICDYCNSLNNWADMWCKACGSPRIEADKEYLGNPIDPTKFGHS